MSGILTGQCHSCKAHLFIGGKEEVSSPVADIKLEDKHDDLNSMIKELEALLHKEKPEVDSVGRLAPSMSWLVQYLDRTATCHTHHVRIVSSVAHIHINQ